MTVEDIEIEWRKIRPAVGNLICYIDGKVEQLKSYEDAYSKGLKDAEKAAEADKTIEYLRGLEDAWSAARKINNVYTVGQMETLFMCDIGDIMDEIHPQSAIEMLKDFEEERGKEKNLFVVGDEVTAEDGTARFVVTHIGGDVCGIDKSGKTYAYMPDEIDGKTGAHFKFELWEHNT